MSDIFKFSLAHCDWQGKPDKALLGGKGAGLVQMARDGLNVPPGFTITTKVCNAYLSAADTPNLQELLLDNLMVEVEKNMGWLQWTFGYTPLVSVRSGAAVSMPGMMDTILNVGLCTDNRADWAARIGERATADSQRRLIQMLGATAYGVPMGVFDFQLAKVKKEVGAKSDTDLTAGQLLHVGIEYVAAFEQNKGFAFPINDRTAQLRAAIKAVFDSWMNPRAIEYRKINGLSDAMGTAVTVQAMVFGNMGEDSGTGVLFSRDPSTGQNVMMGEFLTNAQGEDVVAGIRTPINVKNMSLEGPAWAGTQKELVALCAKLEKSYSDMVDVEFTVQKGQLFVLQSRTGKRSARAAFKIAVDMEAEGVIDRKTALSRLTVEQYKVVRRKTIDPKCKLPPNLTGLPACPGIAVGKPVFSAEEAVACKEPCILVTHETNPNDIAGMAAAVGILTQTGGATSHAAVVARAMDKTCITGCTALDIENMKAKDWTRITIDGSTGNVWFNVEVPVIDSSAAPEIKTVLDWCLEAAGKVEAVAVDKGMGAPHVIMAAHWWGNGMVLDAVLTALEKLPSREHITLDRRAPSEFAAPADAALTNCFGQAEPDDFEVTIANALVARGEKLAGLTIFKKEGVIAIPREYAAFTVLAH